MPLSMSSIGLLLVSATGEAVWAKGVLFWVWVDQLLKLAFANSLSIIKFIFPNQFRPFPMEINVLCARWRGGNRRGLGEPPSSKGSLLK